MRGWLTRTFSTGPERGGKFRAGSSRLHTSGQHMILDPNLGLTQSGPRATSLPESASGTVIHSQHHMCGRQRVGGSISRPEKENRC